MLEAEVIALRAGRTADADALRQAREQSASAATNEDAAARQVERPGADAGSGAAPVGSAVAGPLPAVTSSPADADGVAPAVAPADDEPADGESADGTGQHGAVVRSEST